MKYRRLDNDINEVLIMTVTIEQVRKSLAELIDRANAGEEIRISQRGREVARLVPPSRTKKPVPFESLADFRKTIKIKGEPASQTLIKMRREERA
jgi:prevent-host-death family protein